MSDPTRLDDVHADDALIEAARRGDIDIDTFERALIEQATR